MYSAGENSGLRALHGKRVRGRREGQDGAYWVQGIARVRAGQLTIHDARGILYYAWNEKDLAAGNVRLCDDSAPQTQTEPQDSDE